jgi:hypothetical protein
MKTEGLRYSFHEVRPPRWADDADLCFRILDGQRTLARATARADALKITRALNREDLRLFAQRAKVGTTARPTPKRRYRSKRQI